MKIQAQTVQIGERQIQVYRLDLSDPDQKALYDGAKEQGLAKAPYTHSSDPGNQKRPPIVVRASQILGTLADAFTAQILREHLPEGIEVVRYDDIRTDDFKKPDQFDIVLKAGVTEKIVEVRSSIAKYLPTPAGVINQFKLLGWYSTANKPGEVIRDYYFQPVFITLDRNLADGPNARTFKSTAPQYLEEGRIVLYLLGSATRNDLETRGRQTMEEELLQEAAVYQTMQLTETRSIAEIIPEIRADFGI